MMLLLDGPPRTVPLVQTTKFTEESGEVSPDGKRFLMIDDSGGGPDTANAAGVVVVLNWAEEVKAKLPAAKR